MSNKIYVTTDRAGFVVAGRRVPVVTAKDGALRAKSGFEIELSEAEASYELAQGTIVLKGPAAPAPRAPDVA